jgi:hypothetical protein
MLGKGEADRLSQDAIDLARSFFGIGDIGVALKILKADVFEHLAVRGRQDHGRRQTGLERLAPASGTQAPAITSFQAGKAPFGSWRHEIVAALSREQQKSLRDPGANHMGAMIVGIRVATTIPEVTGERIIRAGLQWFA